MRGINPGYGQFRWMALLLTVAVILPTLCLLWFMHEVVKNERLAVHQRLTTFYEGRLAEVTTEVEQKWAQRCAALETRPGTHAYRLFTAAVAQNDCDALLVYDDAGRRLYPALSTDGGALTGAFEGFADAVEMEFRGQYEQAVERYEQYARISDSQDRLAAWIGKSRSLARLGRLEQAILECQRAASSPLAETGDSRCLALIASARLLMLGWMQGRSVHAPIYEETFRRLLVMLYAPNGAGAALPADQNLFLARKALELGRESGLLVRNSALFRGLTLERLIETEERSIRLAQQFADLDAFSDWKAGRLQPLRIDGRDFYGVLHASSRGTCVALVSRNALIGALADYTDVFDDDNVDCSIYDEAGRVIAGVAENVRKPFAAGAVGRHLPWKILLFFKGGDVFERAASERIAIYTWTGLLVIGLILGSGAVAAKSIGKQVKLNRLKNDFIATVTHELKTPLSSMRVLVDTLLEGGLSPHQRCAACENPYSNPQQVMEYLQLVAKENERLSRLIDNFLSFSRMERNKQAFQMRQTSPTSIARTAAEAVRTKLGRGNCRFETDIPDELPAIKADHDAMVTVLVNLLDNAYKYSYDEKKIKLRAATENGRVCFSVSDNGLGIPRRALKKIFRRFYQVDRSLSRRTEGCGLGLSIAKFIVDAHEGKITVDSRPGQGSTFTVVLPALPHVP